MRKMRQSKLMELAYSHGTRTGKPEGRLTNSMNLSLEDALHTLRSYLKCPFLRKACPFLTYIALFVSEVQI